MTDGPGGSHRKPGGQSRAGEPTTPEAHRVRLLPTTVAIVFSATVPQFGMNLLTPALPQIGAALQAPQSAWQYVVTVYLIGYALAVLAAGFLAERFGVRRVHLWGVGLFCLSTVLAVFAPSFAWLLGLRFLQALGGCGITVLSRLIVQKTYPPEAHIGIVATLALAVALTPSVAPLLGGALLGLGSWQLLLWVLLILGGLSGLLFWWAVPTDTGVPSGRKSFWTVVHHCVHEARHPGFIRYLLAISLVSMGQIAFLANSAYPLQMQASLSPRAYGALLGVIALGFVLGTQTARRLVPRHGIDRLLRWAALASMASAVSLPGVTILWPGSAWGLALPMFVAMLVVGMVVPLSQTGLLSIPSRHPGYLASLFFFAQIALSTGYGMGVALLPMDLLTLACATALPYAVFGGMVGASGRPGARRPQG